MNSLTDILFGFFDNILAMANQLNNFLFSTIQVGSWSFQMRSVITGGLFITLIISWLVGKIIGWGWLS